MSFDFWCGVFATVTTDMVVGWYLVFKKEREIRKAMDMLQSTEKAKQVKLSDINRAAEKAKVDLVTFRIPQQEYYYDEKERSFKTELKPFGEVVASGASRQWLVITLAKTMIEKALQKDPDLEIKTPDF